MWQFQFALLWTAAAAGDLQIAFSFPAAGTVNAMAADNSSTDVFSYFPWNTSTSDAGPQTFGGTAANKATFINGFYTGGGTAGTFKLRWAQGVSNGTATTLRTNSALWAVKLA